MVDFNADFHEYTINGRVIPSVTQILKNTGYIDDRFFTEEARDRGTAVHELCRRYADGERQDKMNRPLFKLEYVNAFSNWMHEKHVYVIKSESTVYGNINGHEYAGMFDILADINGKIVLVDIKTGTKLKWHPLQLAAYAMAKFETGNTVNPDKLVDLYVSKNGAYKESYVNPVELPVYIKQFKEALIGGNYV